MPKFAANLSMLFTEVDFLDRFKEASAAGFQFIEYLFPYEYKADTLKSLLDEHQLKQILFNLPPGDWAAGERGIACHPDRINEFREGVDIAINFANALGVKQLNCLAGLVPSSEKKDRYYETLVDNLKFASSRLAQYEITLMVEAINSKIDMPGFLVDTSPLAESLIKEVASDNLRFQYDIYHMQIMEGDLTRSIERLFPIIGHIQFADNPGRHEPGTGEINLQTIFDKLDELGYEGWVSAEYLPSKSTTDTLGWLQSFN